MTDAERVRPATPSDATRISALTQHIQALHAAAMPDVFKPASAQTFSVKVVRHLLAQPECVFLVFTHAEYVIGHVYAEVQHVAESAIKYATSRILVHQLVVDAEWQRRGIGKQLLNAIREVAEEREISTLVLDVWDFNNEAHAFYVANGFRDTRHALSLPVYTIETRRSGNSPRDAADMRENASRKA